MSFAQCVPSETVLLAALTRERRRENLKHMRTCKMEHNVAELLFQPLFPALISLVKQHLIPETHNIQIHSYSGTNIWKTEQGTGQRSCPQGHYILVREALPWASERAEHSGRRAMVGDEEGEVPRLAHSPWAWEPQPGLWILCSLVTQ